MIKILFQGDSITDGNRYKDPEMRWDLNHQIGQSYVFNIVGKLGLAHPGKYQFVNRGVSGDQIEKITARWQVDTLDEHPDVLSLLLGINGNGSFDGVFPEGTQAHLENFERGYRALLDAARQQNPDLKLILVEPFALPTGHCKAHYEDFAKVFRQKQEIIARIAADYHAVFIPVQKRLDAIVAETAPHLTTDPYAYWLWDGIHPTETMHCFLANLWLEGAAEIL